MVLPQLSCSDHRLENTNSAVKAGAAATCVGTGSFMRCLRVRQGKLNTWQHSMGVLGCSMQQHLQNTSVFVWMMR